MSEDIIIIAFFMLAMIGGGVVGGMIVEGAIRFAIWRGWMAKRVIYVRLPDYERAEDAE